MNIMVMMMVRVFYDLGLVGYVDIVTGPEFIDQSHCIEGGQADGQAIPHTNPEKSTALSDQSLA